MKTNIPGLTGRDRRSGTVTEKEISRDLMDASARTIGEVYERLGISGSGLSEQEAGRRTAEYGPNLVAQEKPRPWYVQLPAAFKSPFNIVLLAIALVAYFTKDYLAVTLIAVMVLISALIKFIEEYKSGKGAEALKKMVHTNSTVIRLDEKGNSSEKDIPMEELVPGDIIKLSAGDIIPADLRIVSSRSLLVSQSALTGESLPVEKHGGETAAPSGNALELENICYMGTSVNVGSATAVVLATGARTYFGAMAETILKTANKSAFDMGINKVSWLLIRFMAVTVPIVFLAAGFTKGDWLQALMFALSLAVALTPEMLPMVVTSNLAKGAVKMAKAQVIVKKLPAIQDFGAMNILCTDKTGTLTEDRIVLMKHTDAFLNDNIPALQYAYLNSYFETSLRNMMDTAILTTEHLTDRESLVEGWQSVDELPFDFERRRMSVILKKDGRPLLICKGAIEEMLACSSSVTTPEGEKQLTEELKSTIKANVGNLNSEGLRVIAVGHRYFPADRPGGYTAADESGLVLDGVISFLDPPKESAKEAIRDLSGNGISIKVLTGDNDMIAKKVCSEVGLTDDRIILGSDIEELPDDEAYGLIAGHRIFAKLAPMQKARVVRLLRQHGNVVGYLGDGINDAASLREADIGISVDTGVDVAKESADIILLRKSLGVLNQGVTEGRKMFANTMKYIKITVSSYFGNVLSLLGASLLFPFLPLLPLQILILNLVYDISQIAVPWDNVDPEYLSKPRKWEANDITRFMFAMGPVNSLFDYATFGVLWFVIGADTMAAQGVFQTGWFIQSLLTQTFVFHILRTEKTPFIRSNASWQVMLASFGLMAAGMALTFTGLGHEIGFTKVPAVFYYWVVGITAAYCLFAQSAKRWYIKRFKSWI